MKVGSTAAASRVGRRRKPGFIESCNPSEVDKPPTGKVWGHEIKWDGYRGQVHLDNGAVQIFTRAGNDWRVTFHPISETISRLRATSAILEAASPTSTSCAASLANPTRRSSISF